MHKAHTHNTYIKRTSNTYMWRKGPYSSRSSDHFANFMICILWLCILYVGGVFLDTCSQGGTACPLAALMCQAKAAKHWVIGQNPPCKPQNLRVSINWTSNECTDCWCYVWNCNHSTLQNQHDSSKCRFPWTLRQTKWVWHVQAFAIGQF